MTAAQGVSPDRLDGLALARTAVDRVAEHRGDAQWLDDAWSASGTQVLRVHDGRVLGAADAAGPRLGWERVDEVDGLDGDRFLLGVDDAGTAWFALHVHEALTATEGLHPLTLREIGTMLGDRDAGLFAHAVALSNWHRTHTHCPRCGTPTVVEAAGHVRRCPADDSEHYPRTDPAVIVLVTDATGERALLGSSGRWGASSYSTLAGFVEPGESAEMAVVREVHEESGVEIDPATVQFLGSQPWPFPSSLMLGFTARARGGLDDSRPDGDEIRSLLVVTRDELGRMVPAGEVHLSPRVSIARRLIEHWYGGELEDGPGHW